MPAVPESFDLKSLARAYAAGLDPRDVIAAVEARIAAFDDPALFIARPDRATLDARAAALAALSVDARAALPLYGVPFAVKDNIDVAGLPTTAACPDFAYAPSASATTVAKLEAAGAIVIGKTNLDQFATGLVGVRSPYGVPRNTFDPARIPGGSSSGSAVAVAAGIAAFSLGTDTAGSGRVPAGLNNLVGLKPTPGLASTTGVLPACRTLDCVSIFALTVDDATAVLDVMAGFDPTDAFSKVFAAEKQGPWPAGLRLGVPGAKDRHFFGDTVGEAAYAAALERIAGLGATLVEIDFEPLFAVARLLYEGPWVAERLAAIEEFVAAKPEAMHPVTRAIIAPAGARTAVEAFKSLYKLKDLARIAEAVWTSVDALVVPTVPRAWTVAEVEADPIATNSALGTYTNFVNLLGLSALAVPVALRSDGFPSGVTLIGEGGRDGFLAGLGRVIEGTSGLPLGATGKPRPAFTPLALDAPADTLPLVVFGAHLSGLALNHELTGCGATLIGETRTAPLYRMHALAGAPVRPGLIRVGEGGAAIKGEIWAVPFAGVGALLARIAPPLGLGTVVLEDGQSLRGFICETAGVEGAPDVSHHGGWRAYLAARA
ncbi:allophanate hydrolase [Methyloraptor flagellatus]|uniref:Allophanate hydrolase n=1 Tax=Methyloraptor flagellatus TaxID=3162530 RepID=A0AAU7XBZ8_9HYPH